MYTANNLINKKFKEANSGERAILSSYNGEQIISFPDSDISDLSFSFKVANSKKEIIKNTPLSKIIDGIKSAGQNYLIDPEKRKLITLTTGSPINYVNYMSDLVRSWMMNIDKFVIEYFGSVQNYENGVPFLDNKKKRIYTPQGITSAILAGDELGLAGFVITQALLSRNPLILRPSTQEIVSTNELVLCLYSAGLQDNVQMIYWKHQGKEELSDFLIKNSVQTIIFGNDLTVENLVAKKDSEGKLIEDYRLKRKIISYTSGKSASIVMEDADLEKATDNIITGATSNKGSECTNTKKVYVHTNIYDSFVDLLKKKIQKLKIGDPLDENTQIGYIGNKNVNAIKEFSKNYTILCEQFEKEGMNLLLLEDPKNNSEFTLEEMPGPTLAVIKIDNLEDAISKANDSLRGTRSTATSVYTNNNKYLDSFFKNLKTHKITVNKPSTYMDFMLPHHGKNLLMELLEAKYVDVS